jgi:hypothetical protein
MMFRLAKTDELILSGGQVQIARPVLTEIR